MTFEQWQQRPVYVTQVRTFKRALELLKIEVPAEGRGLATRPPHVLDTFRALPGHRDQYGQALRDMVAVSIRMDRFNKRHPA